MAISNDAVRIVITGAPQAYRTRGGIATRRGQAGERIPVIKDGRPVVWSYRPEHVRTYQDHLRRAADEVMSGRRPFEGAVCCTVRAFMPMPKNMRKADRLLAERELLPHTKKPDLDGLIKAAKDALKGRVWRDDSQASMYAYPFKVYSPRPRLEIEVCSITTINDIAVIRSGDEVQPLVKFIQGALL